MSSNSARARVRLARAELERAEQQLAGRWQSWRERFGRHRMSLLIGGGLLGGFVLVVLSPRRWSRVGASLFGTGAWLARSPAGSALLGALCTNILRAHVIARRPDARRSGGVAAASPGTSP